ncbi:twin-arginine translocation signal domain-containing protein [Haloferacaceae archaeon DSL9]
MTKDNHKSSRRSVLKGIGATAGAAAGSLSFTSKVAAKNNTSERFLKKAVKSQKVQSICDELGKVNLKRAGSVVLEHTDDKNGKVVIRQAIFFLSPGALIYAETGGTILMPCSSSELIEISYRSSAQEALIPVTISGWDGIYRRKTTLKGTLQQLNSRKSTS